MTGPAEPRLLVPPLFLNALVGGTCDLYCPFCDSWRSPIPEISAEQWAGIWRALGRWIPGGFVTLSGGEPLLRPEIEQIVQAAAGSGLRLCLATSGAPLTAERMRALARWPLEVLSVSIDGFADTHDRLRGRRGLFAQAMGVIDLVKELNPQLIMCVAVVINRANIDELADFTEMLLAKPQIDRVYYQVVITKAGLHSIDADSRHLTHFPPPGKAVAFLDWLAGRRPGTTKFRNTLRQIALWRDYMREPMSVRRLLPKCRVGDFMLTIAANGDVVLCDYFETAGNATEQDLAEIWRGEAAARLRERASACPYVCNYLINCAFEDLHQPPND
jgi:MoaA/NifB/PqqE/SkfB family radical SAM enzyme